MKDDLISRKETEDGLTVLLDNVSEKLKDIIDNLQAKKDIERVWNIGMFNNAICPVCCYDSKIRIDLLDWKYCPACGTRLKKDWR